MTIPNDTVDEKIKLKEFKENLILGNLPQTTAGDFLNSQLYNEFQTSFTPQNVQSFTHI